VYVIDHCKLIEHGSSVHGSWLTQDGKDALAFLEQYGPDWEDKIECIDSEGCSHGAMF
jgi:hypothetical protein